MHFIQHKKRMLQHANFLRILLLSTRACLQNITVYNILYKDPSYYKNLRQQSYDWHAFLETFLQFFNHLINIPPVSYTHLDVYKRQAQNQHNQHNNGQQQQSLLLQNIHT